LKDTSQILSGGGGAFNGHISTFVERNGCRLEMSLSGVVGGVVVVVSFIQIRHQTSYREP